MFGRPAGHMTLVSLQNCHHANMLASNQVMIQWLIISQSEFTEPKKKETFHPEFLQKLNHILRKYKNCNVSILRKLQFVYSAHKK